MKIFRTIAVLTVALSAFGCSGFGFKPPVTRFTLKPRVDILLSAPQKEMLSATNSLAFDILHYLDEASPTSNYTFSPLSLSVALGMLANGADGQTAAQIKEVLGLADYSDADMNAYFKTLVEQLVDVDNSTTFTSANSLWLKRDFTVLTTYTDLLRSDYNAEVAELDFLSPDAVETINGWCAEKTHGKITSITDGLSPETVMLLVNAIYFNGMWTNRFETADTDRQLFCNSDGSEVEVDMMHNTATYPVAFFEGFQAISLPYGNGAFRMEILLPDDGEWQFRPSTTEWIDPDTQNKFVDNGYYTTSQVVAMLDENKWSEITGGYAERNIELSLPRFEIRYDKELNDMLRGLGMTDAFHTSTADFSRIRSNVGMVVDSLYVSKVKQYTAVSIDEKGTEAAAVTAIDVSTAFDPKDQFTVNKPFIFVIREISSDAIIFMGKVVEM